MYLIQILIFKRTFKTDTLETSLKQQQNIC